MRQVKKGSTNISVDIYIIDSSDGTPETGVVYNTSGIDLSYRRDFATVVAITEADLTTPALDDAHEDGGFLAIGYGLYRLDVPDAAFATGASKVTITGTVTGMIVLPTVIQLVDFDPDDAVRMGLTALPNADADAAGGLPISDAGGLDLDAMNTNVSDIETDTNEIQGKLPTNKFMGSSDGADDDGTLNSILTDTGEIGTAGAGLTDLGGMSTGMKAEVNAEADTAISDAALATAANLATVDTVVDAIRAVTDLLPDAGALTDLATILADTGELQTDWVNGGRLDLLIDAIKAVTDLLPNSGALSDLASILTDTAQIGAAGAGLTDLGGMSTGMKAEVNAEVLDVEDTDTLSELTAITDAPATPTLRQAMMLLYMWLRNDTQTTSTERRILNDAGTEIMDAAMSDDATTFSQGKLTAP